MIRKLILTPYEHGGLAGLNDVINHGPLAYKENKIDIPHLLLSALTMSGVDEIHSIGSIQNSKTKLVKKIASDADIKRWEMVYKKTRLAFEPYQNNKADEESKIKLSTIEHTVSQLLYSLKTNSGILTFNNITEISCNKELPIEIIIPLKILIDSMQVKGANLPVIRYEAEKTDVRRFINIIESSEFTRYKEAQSEIEQNQNLTDKTIKSIEKAGIELYKKNIELLDLRNNIIKAIPMTSKVVEMFFGKLPGVLADFSANILSDYLKINKSIPIYSCRPILGELLLIRLRQKGLLSQVSKIDRK